MTLYIKQINSCLLQLAGWGTTLAMGVIACVIPYEVFARYITGSMPVWSGEAATFSLVWATMLGSPLALARGYHVGITYMIDKLPRRYAAILQCATLALVLLFLLLMLQYGLIQTIANLRQFSPATGIPMAIPYMAVPIGFSLMVLVTVEQICALVWPAAHREERP